MQAIQLMLKHRIGSLPVVDADGTLVGIVTESDCCGRNLVPRGALVGLNFLSDRESCQKIMDRRAAAGSPRL